MRSDSCVRVWVCMCRCLHSWCLVLVFLMSLKFPEEMTTDGEKHRLVCVCVCVHAFICESFCFFILKATFSQIMPQNKIDITVGTNTGISGWYKRIIQKSIKPEEEEEHKWSWRYRCSLLIFLGSLCLLLISGGSSSFAWFGSCEVEGTLFLSFNGGVFGGVCCLHAA